MSKNVILKSILRQPIRNLLLCIIVAFSGFMVVSQFVEHVIIQYETERIGAFYRSIGYIEPIGRSAVHVVVENDTIVSDVSLGAELISQSQWVDFEDRRVDYFASLNNIQNTMFWGITTDTGQTPHLSDAYFHGVLLDKAYIYGIENVSVNLIFRVEEIEVAYEEHLSVGEEVILYTTLPNEMKTTFDEMTIGERYFVRGTYYHITWHPTYALRPIVGGNIRLDNYHMLIKPFGNEQLWFYPSREGEKLDFDSLGLSNELLLLRENQQGIFLRTTKDMTANPFAHTGLYGGVQGRFLDLEDYQNANPVIVICSDLAWQRNLHIGDVLSLTLRDLNNFCQLGILREMIDWESYPTYQLDLEIVGTFAQRFTANFYSLQLAYIPESIIPFEFRRDDEPICDDKYSFVLTTSKVQQDFIDKNRDDLQALGFEVVFLPHHGEEMWEVVRPILHSGRINIVIFTGLFIVVIALVSALSIFVWSRYFTIMRALGCSKEVVLLR